MTLDQETKQEIILAFEEAIRNTSCKTCPLPEECAEEVGHFCGFLKDIGSGDISQGIECLRGCYKAIAKFNERMDKVSLALLILIFTTILSGVITATWIGIKKLAGVP